MNNRYFQKSVLILALYMLILPIGAEAAMTKSEINEQLRAISFVLAGLNRDLQNGRVETFLIKSEIQRISQALSPLLSEAYLAFSPTPVYPAGQVLGASSSQQSIGAIGFAITEPSGSGSRQVIADRSANIFYFKVKAFYADVEVKQVDITFDNRMWRWAEEISLISGGKTLAKKPAEEFNFSSNNGQYTIHLGGFSLKIPEDKRKTLHVRVKIRKFIPSETDIKVFLNNFAVRVSGHPSVHYRLPEEGGGPDGDYSKQFRVKRDPNED